jgi:hypothetical protein
VESRSRGVLDTPLSRGMTAKAFVDALAASRRSRVKAPSSLKSLKIFAN